MSKKLIFLAVLFLFALPVSAQTPTNQDVIDQLKAALEQTIALLVQQVQLLQVQLTQAIAAQSVQIAQVQATQAVQSVQIQQIQTAPTVLGAVSEPVIVASSTNKLWWAGGGGCVNSLCSVTIGYTDEKGNYISGVPLTVEVTADSGAFVNYQDSQNLVSVEARKLVTKTKVVDAYNPYKGITGATGIYIFYNQPTGKPNFTISSPDGLSLGINLNNY